ncbi:MAG: sigma-54-dependent Fis family transcriptional regulator [Armatimonadetes bacterium]|nr:sigma-54-dependent Fis family transcriptional regulator [Armatimonadota bacterium]
MKEPKRLLIVDDEPHIRRVLQAAFEKAGYGAGCAGDAAEALEHLRESSFDLVLTDVTMPGMTGYELLREIKAAHPEIPVVIMTAYGTIPAAVQAIRDGAFEYITKPFDLEVLKKVVASALEEASRPAETAGPRRSSRSKAGFQMIAESPAMKEVLATIEQVADSKATVLVTGESGVGKEVVAKALHTLSARSAKPFVAVSCAALPETLLESELFGYEKGAFTGANGSKVGRFELAHTGTLFLDEIGDIPATIQIKLLRVLQEREFERLGASRATKVDIRLVTATNRDLAEAVEAGTFRLDLMYRLQVVEISIPPLRERLEDIQPLAEHFLAKCAADNGRSKLKVGADALRVMQGYRWPGNVRELENTMERATVLAPESAEELTLFLLPPHMRKAA